MTWLVVPKANWWQHFLLKFCRTRVIKHEQGSIVGDVHYKRLFGKTWFV